MLELPTSFKPMDALSVEKIPEGPGWLYEPKWDGFRCLAFRDGKDVHLQSKSGQPLARYFPEMVAALASLKWKRFVVDGELTIPIDSLLSFDALLARVHPAASRIRKLSVETPAQLIVFDILADRRGKSLVLRPLEERRRQLQAFARTNLKPHGRVILSPSTKSLARVKKWYQSVGGNLDGIIAKRLDSAYRTGERAGMVKIKVVKTVDCVLGGFRYATHGHKIGSLLLGLYDEDGLLHHVGFTSAIKDVERERLTKKLEKLVKSPGFTGRAPGAPSRWSTNRSTEWQPLIPCLVVEVSYDHFTGGRFRHGTHLLRWRPDKSPRQCTLEQIALPREASI